ncbi:MAG: hypothetical protein AAF433_21185 [Bacteroidota bacterium]
MADQKQILNITLQKGTPATEESSNQLPPLTKGQHFFYGAAEHPLLAPRGVCIVDDKLIVADTGQNRVFIWEDYRRLLAEGTTHADPLLVLGQADEQGTGRNAGGSTSAHSLHYPSGIWSDGKYLMVADAWNHRVLIWHEFPTTSGQAADTVLGQPDFISNQPNVAGIGAAPTAKSLNWPYGLFSDGHRLWIADTGNRRILVFDKIPTENYTAADQVIGKASFTERDYDHHDPIWPYSVKIGPKGELLVADTQYYRCLFWKNWQDAGQQHSDLVIGQPSLSDNGMNQYDLFPRADTLSWCYDAGFYQDGLLVADTGNSRILWFNQIPQKSGTAANNLIGKPHFRMGSENAATVFGTEAQLYWPFSLCTSDHFLALADTGNHRVSLQELIK